MHEEIWRGSLGEAVDAFRSARGEIVIVVAGEQKKRQGEIDENILRMAIEDTLARGLSVRDCAVEVSEALLVPKRLVYELALQIKSG